MTQSQRTPADYQAQLDEKRDRLTQLFTDFNPPALEVHASPAEHYRLLFDEALQAVADGNRDVDVTITSRIGMVDTTPDWFPEPTP